MLNTTFVPVRPDALGRLRAWLDALPRRRAELRASYASQGTRHEQFFLLRGERGPVLVLVSELCDAEGGRDSFLHSDEPLDVEFKRLIREVSHGTLEVEVVFDSSRVLAAGGTGPSDGVGGGGR